MSSNIRSIVSFFGVGATAAAGYVVLSTFVTYRGMAPWLASVLCYAALIPFAYVAQRSITFQSTVAHKLSFPKYLAVQCLGLMLAGALPYFADLLTEVPPVFAFLLVAATIVVTNLLLLKHWVFASK